MAQAQLDTGRSPEKEMAPSIQASPKLDEKKDFAEPKPYVRGTNKDEVLLCWRDLYFSVPQAPKKREEPKEPSAVPPPQGNPAAHEVSKKVILDGLSGYAAPGELIGLLGPSGCGKTVFYNVISQRLNVPPGAEYRHNVTINKGIELTRDLFGKIGAYVMQDDVLLETLRPKECLDFSANLRLVCSPEKREEAVQNVIRGLNLNKCVASNVLVGNPLKKGISGGEKKRTSIGVEIVTDPSLIILDELTSGLDSFTAYTIVKLMRDLAWKEGKTVIAVVHQPSTDIFNLFDRIYLLASGREIYQGPQTQLKAHFADVQARNNKLKVAIPDYTNPADHLIKILHAKDVPTDEDKERLDGLSKFYTDSSKPRILDEMAKEEASGKELNAAKMAQFRATSFWLQFTQLMLRASRNLIRNPTFTKVRIGQTIILGIIIDLLFWNKSTWSQGDVKDKNGAFFFICTAQFMLAIQSVLLTFPLERGLFLREQANRMYGVLPYYLTKSFVELPYQLAMPILFSLIIYWAIGFRNEGSSFFIFVAALLLLVFFGNSLGVLMSSMFANVRTAFAIVPVIVLPLMLFAGFMSNVDSIVSWLAWLQYISPIRYTLEIFFRNEYKKEDFEIQHNPMNPYPIDGYNFDIGMGTCFIVMACIGVGTRILAFFFLKAQTRGV